jgi:HAD superfamily hydrolase (TIGR01549 family)
MNQIEWIFFDMGYTLVNEDEAHNRRIDIAIDELSQMGICVTREQFWEEIYRQGAVGHSPVPSAAKYFGLKTAVKYNSEGECAYSDAKETLMALKSMKYKLGIIANQPLGSEERLDKYGLGGLFDAVFPSAEVGINKPDTKLYLHALECVGCDANRSVMVGDRLDNDIAPAAEVGMRTVRVLRGFFKNCEKGSVKPDYIITSLTELVDIFSKKL